MKKISVVFTFLSAIVLSCGNPHVTQQLDAAEAVMDEHPDSALAIIRSIDTLSLKTRSVAARYSLLHAMALDKNYIDTTDISIIRPAVGHYSRHGAPDDKLKAYYYLGRIQYNADDLKSAAISYSKAERLEDEAEDWQTKGLLYMAFADVYNKTRNKEKEEEYVKKGITVFEKAGDEKHKYLSSGRLALVYYGMQEWHKADSLFSKGIEQAKEDTVAMSVYLSNYARMKVVQPEKDPAGSIELLKELAGKYKQPLSLTDYGVWAYAACLTGDEPTCSQIESQLNRLEESKRITVKNWLYRIEQHRGNYEKALEYQIESSIYNWNTLHQLLSDSIGQALQSYYSEEARNNERETKIVRLRLMLIVLGLCLLFLVALVVMKNRQNEKEKEAERLLKIGEETAKLLQQQNDDLQRREETIEAENKDLQKQVSLLKRGSKELETSLKRLRKEYVSTYKDKFAAIGEMCSAYLDTKDRENKQELIYRRVQKQISLFIGDEKLQAHLESMINKDLNDIVSHLKVDLPQLSQKDILFVCYCIIGLEPGIISTLLNISLSNVYTKRSRLRERIKGLDSPYKEEYLRML